MRWKASRNTLPHQIGMLFRYKFAIVVHRNQALRDESRTMNLLFGFNKTQRFLELRFADAIGGTQHTQDLANFVNGM